MKTLIELYDERAIENVIGPETFSPERVIYLCPPEIAENQQKLRALANFLASRGISAELTFSECSLYRADKILEQLSRIADRYEGCVVDITGGTDAALFAAGMFCKQYHVPAITYSRKRNSFYNIMDAPFAENLPCRLTYQVEEFFRMAGGTMRPGRVDNRILGKYMDLYDPFFSVYLRYKTTWVETISYFQKISQDHEDLRIAGAAEQKGDHGKRIHADTGLLSELQKIGFLHDLQWTEDTVSFVFADPQIRSWLRDVGSVLELFMYKQCLDAGIFHDIISSAIVDWDDTVPQNKVSNEIDVVASRGVIPVFISCKTCEIKTEALNELAILRDRFGGKGAKAVIVTTERCNAPARHRAAQLGIAVIDAEELASGSTVGRLKTIMKANPDNL